jgi:pimeloyl-ACP methyl ester carboxylesterase
MLQKEEIVMPYATNQGIRIHYQVEGEGPPLVFQHGFSSNLESWYDAGYVHALQHDYQLILIDARGHGASDKPHDPEAYTLQRRVGDIVTVLDHLHIAKAHFFGYSMGGWIGFGLAQYAPERFHTLIIGGSHPYARSMDDQRQALRKGIEQGREAYVADLEALDGPLSLRRKARALAADLEAFLAASQDRPSLEAVLPTMTMPCLLFAGGADPLYPAVRECVKQMPNVTFFSLPDLGHREARARSDLVLPHITKFLATMPC